MTDATKRNASTARRSRRDRHHYLAGYLAGVEAGLKEAEGIAGEHNKSGDEWVPGSLWDRLHREFTSRIRARIAEIEGESG